MRDFLNLVLTFIGATSLTDLEFETLEESLDDTSDNALNYAALLDVLDSRESVSTQKERLRYYYLAKGVAVDPAEGKSNILIGGGLCE